MLEEAQNNEQLVRTLANGDIKVLTNDEHQFRRTVKILEKQNIEYHRYQLKTEKMFKAVIRGLHPNTDICDIKRELADLGHLAHNITNVQIKKKKDQNNKNSDWIHIRLPLFFVELEPQTNNKDIFQVDKLCHHKVQVEHPRNKKKEIPQCKNCQAFNHTQNYCHKTPICVKCGEKHKSEACTKSKKTKAICANCGENHTANWKGCSAYKAAEAKANPKKVTAVQRIQSKAYTNLKSDISYAQATKTNTEPAVETKTTLQAEPSLCDVLLALNSVTQTLAKLTLDVDKLKNNQPKSNKKQKVTKKNKK